MVLPGKRVAALGLIGAALFPPEPPRYSAAQLECAQFEQTVRSEIATSLSGAPRRETAGIAGRLVVRAAPGGRDSLRVEAWFDSLSVWRRSAEGTLEPETDGLIGGRYRGTLAPFGRYRAEARPFVPDELAEVADLSTVLDDLFPRLPPAPLAVGQAWADSNGLEIRRLPDSAAASGEPLLRFRLTDRRKAQEAAVKGDTVPIQLQQTMREEGTFTWHPRDGLLRRDRQVTVETNIPAGGRVRRPVRSRIEQRIVLERLSERAACPAQTAAPDRTEAP
ncbi:MAG TPA: hypothetical protein VFS33_10000 [Gemmatimonadales bacterium]|nr:hypothetical protein [Gemmatimonadales bacterium]